MEIAGELIADPVISEAQQALNSGRLVSDTKDVQAVWEASKEILTLHELIAHRLFQASIGQHRSERSASDSSRSTCQTPGMGFGRLLIVAGIVLIIAGVAISLAGRFTPLGRLPGDVVYRRGNFTFYFPVVTSILLSVALTLVMWLISRR